MNIGTKSQTKEAPQNRWNRALHPWKGSCKREKVASNTSHGFMSALLDRMGWKANCKQVDSPDPVLPVLDGNDPSGIKLDDTQASPAVSRPMTFTYSTGETPLPQYTIRRGIGIGGFGEVYFAVSDAGKEVAIKRIQRNLEVELRGASHCLNLKHPNLVSLYDICRDESEQSWVVMEYISGPNLREVLDNNPTGLDVAEAKRWFSGICGGVAHLHSAGLVHRDLKPGNVFDDLGIVKVGDYGLSKFISASHRGGHTESVGTFHYMAPEIGRGEYGREIDVYAMGILLYELLTGEVPFDGESCHEIIVKHLTATPDLSSVSQPYRSVIAKALEKEPAHRYQTVGEMLASLGWADGSAVPQAKIEPVVAATPATELVEPVARFTSQDFAEPSAVAAGHRENEHDEPLARAVKQSFTDLKGWWRSLDQYPTAKTILMFVGAVVVLINTSWLLPLLSMIAVFYVPYYVIRQMVLHVRQQPTYAQAQKIASNAGYVAKPLTRKQWRSHMRNELRAKRSIHRMAELSTSWLAAILTITGMTAAAGLIGLHNAPIDAVAVSPYAWMLIVVLMGSLGILGMGKLWERDEGEAVPRRLVLAGLGAAVGFGAYQAGDFLMFLPTSTGMAREIDASPLPSSLYSSGSPQMVAFMAHFALLFAVIRWWKPVDPLRRTRLSLWSLACIVVVAWFVHQVIPIPQPFGMLIAGGIAIATQLSAPWLDARRKSKKSSYAPPVGNQKDPYQSPMNSKDRLDQRSLI